MSARAVSSRAFGHEVRVLQFGREVHLVFIASTHAKSDALVEDILTQLKGGALNLTLMGKPTSLIEDRPVHVPGGAKS